MRKCANCQNQTENSLLCDPCNNRPTQPEEIDNWTKPDLKSMRSQLNMNSVKSNREERLLERIEERLQDMDPRYADIEKLYKTPNTLSYGEMIVETVMDRPYLKDLSLKHQEDIKDAMMDIWKSGYRQVHIDHAILNKEL